MHDGVRLVDKDGNLIIDPVPLFLEPNEEEETPDFEDQGSRAFNYRNERFSNRISIKAKFFMYLVQKNMKIQVHHYF